MIKYRVIGVVAKFGPGQKLGLSGQQIRDRAYALDLPKDYPLHAKDPKKDKPPAPPDAVVTTKAAVEFKHGEVFAIDGDMPRGMREMIIPADQPDPVLPLESPGRSPQPARHGRHK